MLAMVVKIIERAEMFGNTFGPIALMLAAAAQTAHLTKEEALAAFADARDQIMPGDTK